MKKLNSKKILITGASGFLGTFLATECAENGAILFGIDIRPPLNPSIWQGFTVMGIDSPEVVEMFSNNTFDIIYHLAGGASVGESVANPEKDFNSLLPASLKLIQRINTYCPKAHLVLFSSAAVYGNPTEFPITENSVIKPVSPYGIHKALVEQMTLHYSNYYTFQLSILRVFSAYGDFLMKQLFWDVMNKYCVLDSPNNQIILFGTGKETRDFIHGIDVAKSAVLIGLYGIDNKENEIYNIANGNEVEIKAAIECLFSNVSLKPNCTFNNQTREGDPIKWVADISKIKKLGYKQEITIKEGLVKYYKWALTQIKKDDLAI